MTGQSGGQSFLRRDLLKLAGVIGVGGLAGSRLMAAADGVEIPYGQGRQIDGENPTAPDQSGYHKNFVSVRHHGAKGDGRTLDTEAIDSAIKTISKLGGGVVYFPPGRYLTAPLSMQSRVTLYLETGATVLGSTQAERYKKGAGGLINGRDLEDIAIIGRGTIDGQGEVFKQGGLRPVLFKFNKCANILIEGITTRNSASWNQNYSDCENIVIRGINLENICNWNNDGLDLCGCVNVRISDSRVWSGDDGICLKSYGRPTENVVVSNCLVSSNCNAIKCGTESYGGFKNITVTNCVITPPRYERIWHGSVEGNCGVCLTSVDGGVLENVAVSNLAIYGTRAPIFMRLGNRARPLGGPPKEIGTFRKVTVNNVAVESAGPGCEITGLPGHMMEDISLSNIHIRSLGGPPPDVFDKYRKMPIPENPAGYPDTFWLHGFVPSYGFFCRHIKGLSLSNITLKKDLDDERSAMIFQDIDNLRLDGLTVYPTAGTETVLWLDNIRQAMIRGCTAMEKTKLFARLVGECKDIALMSNDLRKAEQVWEFVDAAGPSMLAEVGNLMP